MCVFCFKQKTAYEMRISDWSSDGCSSDLRVLDVLHERMGGKQRMAKADLARLVLLCTDNLYGELKQARRQIPRRGKGKVTGHIKRLVNIQHKAVWREACGNDLVAQLVGLRGAYRGGGAHALNSA